MTLLAVLASLTMLAAIGAALGLRVHRRDSQWRHEETFIPIQEQL